MMDQTNSRESRRVLVVDDDEGNATLLMRLLQHSGHVVLTACDGPAAIVAARAHEPEVVLLDIGLPGMSGFEVARRLREEPAARQAVLIAVSGYAQEDQAEELQPMFDHWLVKPVPLAALQDLIRVCTAK